MSHREAAYAVGQFRDAEAEIQRLAKQAAMVADAEEDAFRALGFPEEGEALDVGCGPGFVAARLMASRPRLRITGVDRDPDVLSQAERRIPALRGDATSLPIPDASMDAAYARVVFRHLPDPLAAVREMTRCLRPGGVVLVGDSDDGTLAVDPVPEGFDRVLAARHASFRRRGGDPHMGRRLTGLLTGAGLVDVRTRTLTISSASIGTEAFAAIILAPLLDAIDGDLCPTPDVERVAAAARRWANILGAFGMITAVLASGRRPE